MVIRKVSKLTGLEVLAQPVMTEDYQVILSEGTLLKHAYIEKLKELGIEEVVIESELEDMNERIPILKDEIIDNFRDKVQTIMEKHMYHHNQDLEKLSQTADGIISNILEEEHVVEKIYDIKERSADVYEHSISVCSLATLTALKLGLEHDKIHDLATASLLHDLGLRYLTIHYENQDVKQLSPVELKEYIKHPVYGYSALQHENWISEQTKQMILYHHERLDGSGFPLHAREISKYSRILQLCDAFDEMICGIGCARTKVYEAVEYLKTYSGVRFDQEITQMFLKFIAVYPVGSMVKTNENEIGMVIRQNQQFPERPVIQILFDSNRNKLEQPVEKDLMKVLNIVITDVIE